MSLFMKFNLISIPYGIFFLLSFVDSVWFFFGERRIYRGIIIVGFLLHILYLYLIQKKHSASYFQNKNIGITLSILGILGFVFFPVQNLNLGDGILLIENAILENLAYGYTVIPDEILEGLIHSGIFSILKSYTINPMIGYKIISTIIGAIFLGILFHKFKESKEYPLIVLVFLSQGGSLLFYGYTENYSIVSLMIFITIFYGFNDLKKNELTSKSIIVISFLAGISALTHLISGFMALGLVYFCILVSNKNNSNIKIFNNMEFYKNVGVALVTALGVIIPSYAYFLFISDLRIEIGLAHAVHPPFLTVKKIFSLNHLKDLVLEAIFMIFPLAFTLKYFYFTEKKSLVDCFQKNEYRFVVLIFIGFFLHFFTYNPLLGYPSDWDLMGFIWIPIFLYVVQVAKENSKPLLENIPLYIIFYIILLVHAYNLKITEIQASKIEFLETSITEYLKDYKLKEKNIDPKFKKSFLHTGYFLYRTNQKIKKVGDIELLRLNESLQKEFGEGEILKDREKWKVFLSNATEFHHLYLERIEKNHE